MSQRIDALAGATYPEWGVNQTNDYNAELRARQAERIQTAMLWLTVAGVVIGALSLMRNK